MSFHSIFSKSRELWLIFLDSNLIIRCRILTDRTHLLFLACLLCRSNGNAFVITSATMSSVTQCSRWIVPSSYVCSLSQWYLISMCLLRLWCIGFFANAIALLASMFNVIGSTKFIPISLNTLEPNQFLDSSKRGHIFSLHCYSCLQFGLPCDWSSSSIYNITSGRPSGI